MSNISMGVRDGIFEGNFSTYVFGKVCLWHFRQLKGIVGHREIYFLEKKY